VGGGDGGRRGWVEQGGTKEERGAVRANGVASSFLVFSLSLCGLRGGPVVMGKGGGRAGFHDGEPKSQRDGSAQLLAVGIVKRRRRRRRGGHAEALRVIGTDGLSHQGGSAR